MKNGLKKILPTLCILFAAHLSNGQRLNVGITFQYLVLKQVKIDSDIIEGSKSYSLYYAKDNRWKFFSAGQSIIIGTVFQLDYKKLYLVMEPSFDLNTYNYAVEYPTGPDQNERLNFQTLFLQVDVPLYLGYQFGATNLIRYSVFAGGVLVLPYAVEYDLKSKGFNNPQYGYFNTRDMENILYNGNKYMNTLAGFCVHFANLGKIDIRYQHRIGSPAKDYAVSFNSVGLGITYYLPVNLTKKKIYYDE
jgi:hypothetical protein